MGFYERRRDIDWTQTEYYLDPVPGDPQAVYDASVKCMNRAYACREIATMCNSLVQGRASFSGVAATVFELVLGYTGEFAQTLADDYECLGTVLSSWATTLGDPSNGIQKLADEYARQYIESSDEVIRFDHLMNDPQAQGANAAQGSDSDRYISARNSASQDASDAKYLLDQQVAIYRDEASDLYYKLPSVKEDMQQWHERLDTIAAASTVKDLAEVGSPIVYGTTKALLHGADVSATALVERLTAKMGKHGTDWAVDASQKLVGFIHNADNAVDAVAGTVEKAKSTVDNAWESVKSAITGKPKGVIEKTTEVVSEASGVKVKPLLKVAGKGAKSSIPGAVIGGVIDAASTYSERVSEYGQKAASTDAAVHFGISTGAAVTGAAVGAAVGSVVPVAGTVVGGAVGFVVGYVGSACGNAFYDNSVHRGEGDGFWDKVKNNLKFW